MTQIEIKNDQDAVLAIATFPFAELLNYDVPNALKKYFGAEQVEVITDDEKCPPEHFDRKIIVFYDKDKEKKSFGFIYNKPKDSFSMFLSNEMLYMAWFADETKKVKWVNMDLFKTFVGRVMVEGGMSFAKTCSIGQQFFIDPLPEVLFIKVNT